MSGLSEVRRLGHEILKKSKPGRLDHARQRPDQFASGYLKRECDEALKSRGELVESRGKPAMHSTTAAQPVIRLAAPVGGISAVGIEARFDATFDGPMRDPHFDGSPEAIDRFPAWLAGGIIVGLSSVFWVGLLTVVGWVI